MFDAYGAAAETPRVWVTDLELSSPAGHGPAAPLLLRGEGSHSGSHSGLADGAGGEQGGGGGGGGAEEAALEGGRAIAAGSAAGKCLLVRTEQKTGGGDPPGPVEAVPWGSAAATAMYILSTSSLADYWLMSLAADEPDAQQL